MKHCYIILLALLYAVASPAAPSHWAFVAPQRPDLPKVEQQAWPRNGIDYFVLARLEAESIRPSAEADAFTLARRLSLDVTGLPPSLEAVDGFVADQSPGAYASLARRFLDSPHYGERWGRWWLDAARYADSNGYSSDGPRTIWPYRDWVIEALNRDMPFDQFAIEQLAGDLLPDAREDQIIATGFHRNTQINQEGGIDREQFRIESVVDRVDTTGSVFLGLTIACAQCHDHKYDPFTQRDYYRLFAFFNDQDEPKIEVKGASTLVLRERDKPRDTHVHIKGDFTRKGDKVSPDVPDVLPELATAAPGKRPNRLDLAHWVVSRRNPLTARVIVNRIWQTYFGRGLVETENDFGTQGVPPTHPQLLDWLAVEFMERGWRLKHIHELIVNSATYRQSSHSRDDLRDRDPANKLLARQARIRLDAELVRDACLTASGTLSRKIGGPPVYPPQPGGVMNLGQVRRSWKPSGGDDRFRRGLYTYFWRATPHPALMVFDAPDSFSACTRRIRSNTPLQALTLLNDRQFFELSQHLARRIEREGPGDDMGKIKYGFRLCVARHPDAREQQRLADLLAKERSIDPASAWTTVARVLLNLDETITRE